MGDLRSNLIKRLRRDVTEQVFGSVIAKELRDNRADPTFDMLKYQGYINGKFNPVAPFIYPEGQVGVRAHMFGNPILPRVSI